ncbi:MAG: hypothetical protein K0R08_141 [Solimicrobium sp.]|jgi:uncharacterized membrane protein YqjE|nr:hypothetical protein [Solimicrobium sp.]
MPFSTLSRITSTLVATLHTRLDLICVELEEELLRFSSYFIYALIAVFCGGIAAVLVALLILVLFWEDHRISVLLTVIAFFSASSAFIVIWLRKKMLDKPRLLDQSIAQFKKDAELLHSDQTEAVRQNGLEL